MKTLKLSATVAFLFYASFVNAQSFTDGQSTIQFGFGVGASFATGSVSLPPLQLRYEKAITENISIGGILGYASSKYKCDDYDLNYNTGALTSKKSEINYSYLLIGLRGNYHFQTKGKFDPYLGLTLGYNKVGASGDIYGGDVKSSAILYGAQIGSNYYFTDRFGAWAELGYGLGYLNFGITFKF